MKQYRRYPRSILASIDTQLKELNADDAEQLIKSTSPNNTRAWRRYAECQNPYIIRLLLNQDYSDKVPSDVVQYLRTKYGPWFSKFGGYQPSKVSECTYEQLVNLAELYLGSHNELLLADVCRLPNLPVDYLYKCADAHDSRVWLSIINNPNASQDLVLKILSKMASHSDSDVRRYAAQHEMTPNYLLENLAKDISADVRYAVAKNPNTSLSLLKLLKNDSEKSVSQTVKLNPNLLDEDEIYDIIANGSAHELDRLILSNAPIYYVLLACSKREDDVSSKSKSHVFSKICKTFSDNPELLARLKP